MLRRRSAEEWEELIKEQEKSGETTRAYCVSHGLSAKYFSQKRREQQQRQLQKEEGGEKFSEEKFIELPAGVLAPRAAYIIEDEGLRIQVNNAEDLLGALRALKGLRC